MITLALSLLVSVGVFSLAFWVLDWGTFWSVFVGAVTFFVLQVAVGIFIKKRITRAMQSVQDILAGGQKRLQGKMARWQLRPPSSMAAAQREMFEDTRTFVREALKATEALAKYRWWVPMIDRQKATAQLQLNWMIKEFARVDQLMPKALMIDPTLSAMKLARLYMKEAPSAEIRKVYDKAAGRLRYNQNVLLAATMSWILVQREDADGAFKVLTEALHNSDNETLRRNHEQLMNNRPAHFSNSGLGDPWYALFLEEPKMHAPRQRPQYR